MKKYYLSRILTLFILVVVNFQEILAQNPEQDGAWSAPIGFEIVPVAAANLPDGRLITWSSKFRDTYTEIEDGMTFTQIFNPLTNSTETSTVTQTNHDMFCPGINNLPDGRILSAGGTSSERTSIYDPVSGIWSRAADMNIRRGYQGNTTLADGSVFTLGGSWSESTAVNGGKDAELWTPETGWILLPGIQGEDIWNTNDLATEARGLYRIDNHLWLWQAPDGRIFHAGPSEEMHWIDVANGGSIVSAGNRGNDTYSMKGTTVMFDIGKILKVGGSRSYDSNTPAKDNAYVIDINTATPLVNQVGNLAFSRTMQNSTVLPNGQVLVTGGLDHAEVFSDTGARLPAELFDPNTNTWRTVAGMATPRTYHSLALLMTDGRVFVGGGGLCDNTPGCVNHDDAEIYSPPYLFTTGGALAVRPTISAPATADYNTSIPVTGSTTIAEFSLIRFSAVTHSTNNEQRRVPVTFTGTAGNYNVNIPDRNLLPPGYYMLFALDGNGVPSIAETIQIGNAIPLEDNPNLVLHLEFEENSGSMAFDSSINGNDATIFNVSNNGATKVASTTNWTSGLFGGAIQMDGYEFVSNTIVDVPYDASFAPIENSVTVMAWVNRSDLQYNVGIMSHDYPAMFFGFHNSLYKWEFPTDTGDSVNCYAGYSPADEWVHIAATYDGTTARLFANGVEICTQRATGNIEINPAEPNFSSFTTSGFYERRSVATISGLVSYTPNGSGVTDEITGKIDELKVYNKALGAEEIKMFYELGVGLPDVPNCPPGTVTVEYKIGNGNWIASNNINASEGAEVYIRAVQGGSYFVTTPQNNNDSPTFQSAIDFSQTNGYRIDTGVSPNGFPGRNDGFLDASSIGQYVITTAGGCSTVVNLNVAGICDPGETEVSAEYRINSGSYQSGAPGEDVSISVNVGDNLRLSLLPNNFGGNPANPVLRFNVIYPNGSMVNNVSGDHIINGIAIGQSGPYQLVSQEGCSVIIDVNVIPVNCDATAIKAEWRLNGTYFEAPNESPVTVNIFTGDTFAISMVPNATTFNIRYGGTQVYSGQGDYVLGVVNPSRSGIYTITTINGCTTTLTLNVTDPTCDATNIKAEWRRNGTYFEAPDEQPVTVNVLTGDTFAISMVPNNTPFTISYGGTQVYSGQTDFVMGAVDPSDNGDYLITSAGGCSTTLTLNVTEVICDATNIRAEWRLNGDYFSAPDEEPVTVQVNNGDAFQISMLPNGVAFTVRYNGVQVYSGQFDYNVGNVTPFNNGDYVITTSQGCVTTLTLEVPCPSGPFTPEYTIDGTPDSGQSTISVDLGTQVLLSTVENNVAFSITDPDQNTTNGDLDLGAITEAQAGLYTFTSVEGCTASLTIVVTDPCAPGTFTPEYTVNGIADSGSASITVNVGDTVSLGTVQGSPGFTITLPDATVNNGNLDLGNITLDDAGVYLYTSSADCNASVTLVVVDPCTPDKFTPQYTIDGVAGSGQSSITVIEGTPIMLDLVQTTVNYSIAPPVGNAVPGPLDLGEITMSQAGVYTFTSDQGCEATLSITVTDATDPCPTGSFTPQYTINGITSNGSNSITVEVGSTVIIDIVQMGVEYTITLPDNATNEGSLDLGAITTDQAGLYTFTSVDGCTATLSIVVTEPCEPGTFTPEYTVNGVSASGGASITVLVGNTVTLGIVQGTTNFSITAPDATVTNGSLDLGAVELGQAGTYTFLSEEGCSATLVVNIEAAPEVEAKLDDIIIYPNPVTDGRVRIVLVDYPNEMMFVSFFDIYGKLVIRQLIPTTHADEEVIDVSGLSGGVYIVEVARSKNDDNTYKKVIKLR